MPAWLEEARRYCQRPEPRVVRAADWLLDNDYQVIRAIRQVESDLPVKFYMQLVPLDESSGNGRARIHDLAFSILSATSMRLSMPALERYVLAYQEVSTLDIAELWALPSMLRFACLAALSEAFEILNPELVSPVRTERDEILQDIGDATELVARAITAFTALQTIEWSDFVDSTSMVEKILRRDPSDAYAQMDFDTRDRYRQSVEELARGSGCAETAVADHAIALARSNGTSRMAHVGYWLIDDGLATLEHKLAYRSGVRLRARRIVLRHVGWCYFLALISVGLAAFAVPAIHLWSVGADLWSWAGGMALSALPVTILSIAVVHWLTTLMTKPRMLPRMDFRKGIPHEHRTIVCVPVIVAHRSEIADLIEQLEIRYLSNPDPELIYVLLSDYADAVVEHAPNDAEIVADLVQAVDALNDRHASSGDKPFCLIHRERRLNSDECCWMGWERKRGKLEQFNRFVLGGEIEDVSVTTGDVDRLRGARYIITLDADTTLPTGTAAKLVGAIAHPLNCAVFDPQSERLSAGYAIIQPRIEILPQKGAVSTFCRLFSGDTTIDIYSRPVSDLYQDLFSAGVFVGKGIYDIAAFQRCTADRIPINAVLSHDLLEGILSRTAYASGIVLYETFPSTYPEYAMRLHRWVRGDWQLVPWLRRKIPVRDSGRMPSDLSILDRWKIADNLRRSLVAPALLAFFVGGWIILPGSAWIWTLMAAFAPGTYLIGEILSGLAVDLRRGRYRDFANRMTERGGRWFLTITFLIADTMVCVDGVFRTLYRLLVTRQHLMEWRSAAHVASGFGEVGHRAAAWRFMWPSSVFAAVLGIVLALYRVEAFVPAVPILLLWFTAPEIAAWLGKPRRPRRETLGTDERIFLRLTARKTWLYFETFAGPEENWLPPDNYQEDPKGEIAHRTSPTNIGLYLTSALAALDFGFISLIDFVARSRNVLTTLDRMQTYRGHVLNWYDTRTLEPLEPKYASTVDSGNLAICLIAIKQGCQETTSGPVIDKTTWDGLQSTVDLLVAAVLNLEVSDGTKVRFKADEITHQLERAKQDDGKWWPVLQELTTETWPELERLIGEVVAEFGGSSLGQFSEINIWIERIHHHLSAMRRDFSSFLPWLEVIEDAPKDAKAVCDCVIQLLPPTCPLDRIGENASACLDMISNEAANNNEWLRNLADAIESGSKAQQVLRADIDDLANRAETLAFAMDFTFLYDPEVRLFRIGYNVSDGQPDPNHYDLLATEARLASFFAIAKHDVPLEHWYFLGRPITRLAGKPSILSWNGSMFEYLMPPLFLPGRRDTLLGESESTAVDQQRRYARERGVPWGFSESAFGAMDAEENYQYRAFGAPGLGIRRGISEDLVVAPYASFLALYCWPGAAVKNLRDLERAGASGIFGFYDAMDYTPGRAAVAPPMPVKTYMAHHHGMSIAAIANALLDDVMIQRTLADSRLRTVELLLEERIPWGSRTEKGRIDERWHGEDEQKSELKLPSWITNPAATVPQYQFLGNGRMAAWCSESGAGGLFIGDQALTRWRPDPTRDARGYWLYVRDCENGDIWSVGRQPCGVAGEDAKVIFHQHMVEMFRRDNQIAVRMEVTVAPDDDAEIRRLTVVNESNVAREIEFTSYAEVVLAPQLDDERHPAFSKLSVHSEYLAEHGGLLFNRRARRPELSHPMLFHTVVNNSGEVQLIGHETDRHQFVGRGQDSLLPSGLADGLSKATGWTLDPIMALQVAMHLEPMESKQFAFLTCAGKHRSDVLTIAGRYPLQVLDRVFMEARRRASKIVGDLEIDPTHLAELQVLASLAIHPHAAFRAVPAFVSGTMPGQPGLWHFGISGDLPIILIRSEVDGPSDLVEAIVKAQRLWRRSGLRIDLVLLNTGFAGYEEPLREQVLSILRDTDSYGYLGRRGGIHVLSSGAMAADSRRNLEAAAHVVLDDDGAPLQAKLSAVLEQRAPLPQIEAMLPTGSYQSEAIETADQLEFDNVYGGFERQTGDYIMHLEPGDPTPAPWCNILANDEFGTIVSESSLGFTWAINSGENRITPWSNDPVADQPAEALYLRDEETTEVWSATPSPRGKDTRWTVRHRAGSSQWRNATRGLEQTLDVFVPNSAAVKVIRLQLQNQTNKSRRITATYFADLMIGALESRAKPHVVCTYDPQSHAVFATNGWNPEFAGRIAFLAASLPPHSITGDRFDFFGREGPLADPAAMRHSDLGGRFSPGGDACAAYQVHLDIEPGEIASVTFIFGQSKNLASARKLITQWTSTGRIDAGFEDVEETWAKCFGGVQVKTPDRAFDLMINRWLPYQNLSSRLMARAGFYQAGGAFGFRDQLQDVLALLLVDPDRARRQILEASAHQFEEGDVLHWWHPPSGRGVRTRCSDDYLWLAYTTARYVAATGDHSVLDEEVPFITARPLRPDEHDRYGHFNTGRSGTVLDHCLSAFNRVFRSGSHGLPLIEGGDWNDGMDRIGIGGRGESVWLAWFQIATIELFAPIFIARGKKQAARQLQRHASDLQAAINNSAWDGQWFVRAFDDAGIPWGSQKNDECRIDSIAQSWSVLSSNEPNQRCRKAVASAIKELVIEKDRLALLLKPAFDKSDRDPGYIKAYPPGIRENGGQYTHAAAWLGLAAAKLGDGDNAWRIFDIINPIRRSATPEQAEAYMREPYVLTGDVAGPGKNLGKGGWSWYSGAAGWTWQLGVEGILGVKLDCGKIVLNPCLPSHWDDAELELKGSFGTMSVRIENPDHVCQGIAEIIVNGRRHANRPITLPKGGKNKEVVVTLGLAASGVSKPTSAARDRRKRRKQSVK